MPRIHNTDLLERGEEYRVVLPLHLKKLMVQHRPDSEGNDYTLRLAYAEGETKGTEFLTIRPGGAYWEDNIGPFSNPLTVYLRCPEADNQKVEVVSWP